MSAAPNLLVIVADQHRGDFLGHLGGPYPIRTPCLDALAAEGVSFRNAFTSIPLCCPARQALLTGRRGEELGLLWNFGGLGPRTAGLSPTVDTWSRAVQRAGYHSCYIGKWHVSPDADPTQFGYDRHVGLGEYAAFRAEAHPDAPPLGWDFFGGHDAVPLEDSRTHWQAWRGIEFLREASAVDQPWHLRLDFTEPHIPCNPAGRFRTLYDPNDIPPWPNVGDPLTNKPYIQHQHRLNWEVDKFTWDDWAPIAARYYAMISQVDDAVGFVLEAMRETGQLDDTLVVYTSDHGDLNGVHGMMDKHYVGYDEVLRVPLIIRWPRGGVVPALRDDFVYQTLDLAPTLIEWLSLEPLPGLHGRSLVPLACGKDVPDWRRSVAATYNGQQFGLYSQRILRTPSWKYVWNGTDTDELYDLTADPAELHNLIGAAEHAETLHELRSELYDMLTSQGDTLLSNRWLRHQFSSGHKLTRV